MTSLTKPTAAERAKKRRQRFWAKRSTPDQLKLMAATSPMGKVHAKYRTRIVFHCHHRCFVCSNFVGSGGGCQGVRQSSATSTPICHVDAATGRMHSPLLATAAGGLRLAVGQDEHWRTATLDESGRAVVVTRRET